MLAGAGSSELLGVYADDAELAASAIMAIKYLSDHRG
jgi:hypothetical protein